MHFNHFTLILLRRWARQGGTRPLPAAPCALPAAAAACAQPFPDIGSLHAAVPRPPPALLRAALPRRRRPVHGLSPAAAASSARPSLNQTTRCGVTLKFRLRNQTTKTQSECRDHSNPPNESNSNPLSSQFTTPMLFHITIHSRSSSSC